MGVEGMLWCDRWWQSAFPCPKLCTGEDGGTVEASYGEPQPCLLTSLFLPHAGTYTHSSSRLCHDSSVQYKSHRLGVHCVRKQASTRDTNMTKAESLPSSSLPLSSMRPAVVHSCLCLILELI